MLKCHLFQPLASAQFSKKSFLTSFCFSAIALAVMSDAFICKCINAILISCFDAFLYQSSLSIVSIIFTPFVCVF
uniref:Uncharacterized protein n=1 Tax=uncultured marine virus TaxID=186617 RepID=A0A0F7L139_9VIRU|nr:hypothetical protein [uncultured marine virus]